MKSLSPLIVLLLLFLSSCDKDNGSELLPPSSSAKVLVSCEGGFGSGNASLSSYDPSTNESTFGAFEAVNGYSPGDVLQSMCDHLGKLYLVLNGSARIEVIDEEGLQAESPINGLISPRSFLPISNDKAYVSNIFTDLVQVIDLESKSVSGGIDIGGWSEGMQLVDEEAFVTRNDGTMLMVINVLSDAVIDSIDVGIGPKDVVIDLNGDLWVLSFGFDANFNVIDAQISHVDPVSRSLIESYPVPQPWAYKMDLRINSSGDRLYVLNNDIYSMGVGEIGITQEPFIDNGFSNYGLGIDPSNDEIYVGYTPDFSTEGTVFRYSSSGSLIDEFQVGVAPNGFHFRD